MYVGMQIGMQLDDWAQCGAATCQRVFDAGAPSAAGASGGASAPSRVRRLQPRIARSIKHDDSRCKACIRGRNTSHHAACARPQATSLRCTAMYCNVQRLAGQRQLSQQQASTGHAFTYGSGRGSGQRAFIYKLSTQITRFYRLPRLAGRRPCRCSGHWAGLRHRQAGRRMGQPAPQTQAGTVLMIGSRRTSHLQWLWRGAISHS